MSGCGGQGVNGALRPARKAGVSSSRVWDFKSTEKPLWCGGAVGRGEGRHRISYW